jgi:hypothetical protein
MATAPDRTLAPDAVEDAFKTAGHVLAWLQAAARAETTFRARSSTLCPLSAFAREALGLPHPQVSFMVSRRHPVRLVYMAADGLHVVALPRWCNMFANVIDDCGALAPVSRETALTVLLDVMRRQEAQGSGRRKPRHALE